MAGSFNLVGASISLGSAGAYDSCGTGTANWCNAQYFDQHIIGAGQPAGSVVMAQQLQKVFIAGPGSMPSSTPAPWVTFVTTHGGQLLIAVKPVTTFSSGADTDLANFVSGLISDLGIANFKLILYQEMIANFSTAAAYITYARHYAGVVYGVNPNVTIVYDPEGHDAESTALTYYPGDAYCDEIYCDYYQTAYTNGTRLKTLADFATTHSKPFGLAEWGWWAGNQPAYSQQNWDSYTSYLTTFFQGRVTAGNANGWLIYFGSTPNNVVTGSNNNYIPDASDPKVPDILALYQALNAPAGTTGHSGPFDVALRLPKATLAGKAVRKGTLGITLPSPVPALSGSGLTVPVTYAHTAIQNPAPSIEPGSSAVTTGSASATLAATIPSGTKPGDLIMIYCAAGFSGITWSAPVTPGGTATWSKLTQPAGGGTMNAIDISAGGIIAGASDTQGLYKTANKGDTWQVINSGIGNVTNGANSAATAWSVTEAGALYAALGDTGAGGGFAALASGASSWVLRSSVPQFAGNGGPSPLPGAAGPRSTGRLIAQDGTYIYAGTAQQGVMRSANNGSTWPVTFKMAGSAPGAGYFCRGLDYDPGSGTLFGAFYQTGTGNGGLWACTAPGAAAPNFTRITGTPATVEDCTVLGGYVYCAASGSGIWQYKISSGAWRDLSGTTVNTSQSLWNSVDAIAASGSHLAAIVCNTPSGGASFIKLTVPSAGAGTPSYQVLSQANVNVSVLPPDGQSRAPLGSGLTLGSSGSKNNCVRFDPADATGNGIFVSGSNGFYRSADGGVTWATAARYDSAFHALSVAADPNHSGHLIFGSTDYGAVEITDGIGYSAATCAIRSPGNESRCFAFDPADSTMYTGTSVKSAQTSGGEVMTKAWNGTSWTSMGLGTHISGWPVTGLLTFRDGSNNKIVVAATETQGIWRHTSATGNWTQVSTAAFAAQQTPYTGMDYDGAGTCYAFDRAQGVFRSTDYGVTWGGSPIWSGTASGNPSSGWISCNPAVPGELWISPNASLLYLTAASGTPVVHAVTPPGDNGPVLAAPDGTVYCGTQDTGSGIGMYSTTDHGATWTNLDPGGSFAQSSYAVYQLALTPAGTLYAGTGNILTYPSQQSVSARFGVIPAASGTSGSAQLLWHEVDGTEGWTPGTSTVTVTASASHPWSLVITAVAGQTSPFDPVPAASGQVNASATAITAPSVTTVANNDLLVWFGFTQAPSGTSVQTITLPTGYSKPSSLGQASSSGASTSNVGLTMGSLGMLGAGATGTVAGSVPVAQASGAMLVAVPAAGVTITIPVISATSDGNTLLAAVAFGSQAPLPAITGLTDSQGNSYTLISSFTSGSPYLFVFEARGATTALSTSDTVALTLSAAVSGLVDISCSALSGAGVRDVLTQTSGTGTSASAAGTPASSGELAYAAFAWGNSGGAGAMQAPFTQLDQQHAAGLAYLTTGYAANPAASALITAADTITSVAWRAVLSTFSAGGPPPSGPLTITLPGPVPSLAASFAPRGPLQVTLPALKTQLDGTRNQNVSPLAITLPAPKTAPNPVTSGAISIILPALRAQLTATGGLTPFPGRFPNPLGLKAEIKLGGTWTDISQYALYRDPVTIQGMGRVDESSGIQPATLTMSLRNDDGRFTPKNAAGAYFPDIVRNCPVRVSVRAKSATGASYSGYRFHGEVSSWPPLNDISQRDIFVTITAAGIWRRLSQSSQPAGSPYTRYLGSLTGAAIPAAAWPMEDGNGSAAFITETGASAPATFSGTPNFAADGTSFPGCDALPAMNGARITAAVTSAATPASTVVRFALSVPAAGDSSASTFPGGAEVCKIYSPSATVKRYDISLISGQLVLTGFTSTAGGTPAFTGVISAKISGIPVLVSAEITPSGTSISWALRIIRPGAAAVMDQVTGTRAASSVATVTQVFLDGQGRLADSVIGQLGVWYTVPSLITAATALGGYSGELAGDRFLRLCAEYGIAATVIGSGGAPMGPQQDDTLANILLDLENTDGGLLYETRDQFGLGYRTLASLKDQAPAAAISYSDGVLGAPLEPTYDDALLRNQWTVTNSDGYAIQATLVSGAVSVQPVPAGVGLYSGTASVNTTSHDQVSAIAKQRLFQGTVDDFRNPTVTFNFLRAKAAPYFASVPGLRIGDYLQITSQPSYDGPATSRQLAWGYTEILGATAWTITYNMIPEAPFETGYSPGTYSVIQAPAAGVPGGSGGGISGAQLPPGTPSGEILSARTAGGIASFIAPPTPYDWSFPVIGNPADATYFICTSAQAQPVSAGDTFSSTGGFGGPFTVTSVSQSFAGFTNVYFTPDAAGVMSTGTVSGGKNGDSWINSAAGNQVSTWAAGAWVPIKWDATNVITAGTVTASQIAAQTITSDLMAAGIVIAGVVDGTVIQGATVIADGSQGELLVYSGTPASGNLIGSWSGAAGTDSPGNPFPRGLAVEQGGLVLLNQSAVPAAVAGASVLYGSVAGRLRLVKSSGADDVIERGSVNVGVFSVGNTTTAGAVSATLAYKAADAAQSSTYEIEIRGTAAIAATPEQLTMKLYVDGANIGGAGGGFWLGAAPLNTTTLWSFGVTFTMTIAAAGVSGSARASSVGTFADATQGSALQTTQMLSVAGGGGSAGATFDTTADHSIWIAAFWGGAGGTGQKIETTYTRISRYM